MTVFDLTIEKLVEWWQVPGYWAKAGFAATALALLSAMVSGIVKAARLVGRLYHWTAEMERLAPLEGLTAGHPLPTPKFTGRKQEIDRLRDLMKQQAVVAAVGPPLIGKSWLISQVIRSRGMAERCIFIELKPKSGLSALLFAINVGLIRLGCDDFDGVCRRDDLTPEQKAQELRPLLVAGKWVIALDAYERVDAGGKIDRIMESWSKGIGTSHVVLGTRRNPSWLAEGAVLDIPAMAAEQMNTLCRQLGLTKAEADEVCGKLAGLPGAAGVFRGVLERRKPRKAMALLRQEKQAEEKLGRVLFEVAFKAAPQGAREVWMVASWFPQPLTRHAAFVICGEDVFKEGASLLERWTVLTEGSERLGLHAWATRTGQRALRWQWRKRRVWGQRAAAYYAQFAEEKAGDRAAVEGELENVLAAARLAYRYKVWEALWGIGSALGAPLDYAGRWAAREDLLRLCLEAARRAGESSRRKELAHNVGVAMQDRGELTGAAQLHRESMGVARQQRDRAGEAATLHSLGSVAHLRADLEEAERLYGESLAIERELGDRRGEARTLHALGLVAQRRGNMKDAERLYRESLKIKREIGDLWGEAKTLRGLGWLAQYRGAVDEAERLYQQGLRIDENIGDRPRMGMALYRLGSVAHDRGDLVSAERFYLQSLDIMREAGGRVGEATALHALGAVARDRGQLDVAKDLLCRSLEIKREVGDRVGEAQALHALGSVAQRAGESDEAAESYRRSVEIAQAIRDRPGEATTLWAMAALAEEQGDLGSAVELMERAVVMMEEMGLGEAERARGDLERLRKLQEK